MDGDPQQVSDTIVILRTHCRTLPRIRDLFVRAEWRVWHADPFSRSGYSASPNQADDDARQMLGLPVSDTLFFAGEAVGVRRQSGNVASVHGAIESGIHSAREVIAALCH